MSIVIHSLVAACLCAAPDAWADDLSPISPRDWTPARAAHLLERAGFGGTPEEVARLAKMTPAQAVDSLLDYHKVEWKPEPFKPSGIYPHGHKLVGLDRVVVGGLLTGKAYGIKATQEGKLKYQPTVNEFYTLLVSEHSEMRRAAQWWLERMVATPRPLEEKLALFWHDLFATSQEKVLNYELMLAQIETLRKHGSGKFRDLLVAVAQDPAMLVWLDNRDNIKGKPNENFAREVMELFCMGEGQGYTEKDIQQMARAFTGWTSKRVFTTKDDPRFLDKKDWHDDGVKTILGKEGKFDGYAAIDLILAQPATPRHLVRKLYRYFVREEISEPVRSKLAKRFKESGYAVKPLLRTIFLSRDFHSTATVGRQIKAPVPFLVGTYRKLGLKAVPGIPDCTETCGALGQVLFYPPNVAGWPGGRSWLNPATLLVRGNFAKGLLFPKDYGDSPPDKVVAEGYRKIPLQFREYAIEPYVWDPKAGKMAPASLHAYEKYVARFDPSKKKVMEGDPAPKKGMKSKMSEMSAGETYNLAVGVYTGFVRAYDRVKAIPRDKAKLDIAALAKGAKTPEQVVDRLAARFLSVPLGKARREAVVAFLKKEGEGEAALRRAVHLILSAPEYQLN